jgi:hypothetical protein
MSSTRVKRTVTASLAHSGVVLATCTAVVLIAAGTASAAPSALPGGDALYQVEISGNVPGPAGWRQLVLGRAR